MIAVKLAFPFDKQLKKRLAQQREKEEEEALLAKLDATDDSDANLK
jgi:hypothetical protein